MFKVGTRIVHKDSPNTFENSWEIMSTADEKILLGGPGNFESCMKIPLSKLWEYVPLLGDP